MAVVIFIYINYKIMKASTRYDLPSFICHQRIGEDFDYLSILFICSEGTSAQDPLYRPILLIMIVL